tara:strand:+ start:1347 stop:1568 length:222 start_codon:yes stop_codon:yes gene_type:complete
MSNRKDPPADEIICEICGQTELNDTNRSFVNLCFVSSQKGGRKKKKKKQSSKKKKQTLKKKKKQTLKKKKRNT